MKKTTKYALLGAAMSLGMVLHAGALSVTPAWTPQWTGADGMAPEGQLNPLSATQVEGVLGLAAGTLLEAYKSDVSGGSGVGLDSEPFAASYNTQFSNTPSDPSSATITHVALSPIVSLTGSVYLGVKDGNNSPFWYVFDITGWNGADTISMSGFWPQQGAISHVSLFTGGPGGGGGDPVPDSGSTMLLLGSVLLCAEGLRRHLMV